MKIRMKSQITGTRNGVAWPAPGGVVELPDAEGARMCQRGYAEPVVEIVEQRRPAPTDGVESRRVAPRKRKG